MDSWHLINVEHRAATFPETFEIPDLTVRMTLKAGDFAKVVFSFGARIWVEIDEVVDGKYVGAPIVRVPHDEEIAIVEFEPHHVADAMRSEDMYEDDT